MMFNFTSKFSKLKDPIDVKRLMMFKFTILDCALPLICDWLKMRDAKIFTFFIG